MTVKFVIEEEAGGYVQNGDVLEWRWKEPKAEPSAPSEVEEPPEKRKPGRPRKSSS